MCDELDFFENESVTYDDTIKKFGEPYINEEAGGMLISYDVEQNCLLTLTFSFFGIMSANIYFNDTGALCAVDKSKAYLKHFKV